MKQDTEEHIKTIIVNLGKALESTKANRNNISFDNECIERTFFLYNQIKFLVKEEMQKKNMVSEEKGDCEIDLIDRHKIASIILVSLIHSEPFKKNSSNKNFNLLERNAKYFLALRVSISILSFFDQKKNYDKTLQTKYINVDLIKLLNMHLNTIQNICINKQSIKNIFFFSHIFYHIEETNNYI